jgi:hypothetical protein
MASNDVLDKLETMCNLYGKRLGGPELQMYIDVLSKFSTKHILSACKAWIASPASRMPLPGELKQKCAELIKWIDDKQPEPAGGSRCEYQDRQECDVSRKLCSVANDADRAVSQIQFKQTFCNWHYQIEYAKYFPDSSTAAFIKHHLSEMMRLSANGYSNMPKNNQTVSNASRSLSNLYQYGG